VTAESYDPPPPRGSLTSHVRLSHEIAILVGLALLGTTVLTIAIATVIVGALALLLDGEPWVLVAGGALVTVPIATWAVAGIRVAQMSYRPPARRNQVFVSYRTREHGELAARATEILSDEGLRPYFARDGDLGTMASPFAMFRESGFFQLGELDHDIQDALIGADAMVYFVPDEDVHVSSWRQSRDWLESLVVMFCNVAPLTASSFRAAWLGVVYGRLLPPIAYFKFAGASWQSWELQTAKAIGLDIVRIVTDVPPKKLPTTSVIECQAASFETDFREKVLPTLRMAVREEFEVQPLALALIVPLFAGVVLRCALVVTVVAVGFFFLVRGLAG
jgi:hypothetical protein